MIPLKLSLRNFLCYREGVPTLDLEGIHIACLCGENGHGKSALLDAITWALWGKARGVPNPARGRTMDELIHYGRDEMQVELEFEARGNRYRVIRRHARGGRTTPGRSDLQLQLYTGEGFRSISGNTILETQAKLEDLLGMDYETFINSAFLLQGRADEFTTKPPDKRKEVLARILGLERYDDLEQRAREKAIERGRKGEGIRAEIEQMRLEVARKADYQRELEGVRREMEQLAALLEGQRREVEALKLKVTTLRERQREKEELEGRIPRLEGELEELLEEAEASRRRIREYEALLAQRDEVTEGFRTLQELRCRYEELNRALSQFNALSQRRAPLLGRIEAERARLEEKRREVERRIGEELVPKAEAARTAGEELRALEERIKELEREEIAIQERRGHLQELDARRGQLLAIVERLKAEGKELREKLDLLREAHEGARCPLCNTELGPEGCQRLIATYTAQVEEKRSLYKENEASLRNLEGERGRLASELASLEASHRRALRDVQTRQLTLQRVLDEAARAEEELRRARTLLGHLETQLKTEAFAQAERQELQQIDAQIEALGYDPALHRSLGERVEALKPFEERYRQMEEAERSLPEVREALGRAEGRARHRREELLAARSRLREMEEYIADLPHLEAQLATAESSLRGLEERQAGLLGRQGDLEGRLRRVAELEVEMARKTRELTALQEEEGIYQELARAFSRRGIQAMLIESVLPELEVEANNLLGRMTDNRMHLKLETQRERKRGEPVESLEIRIFEGAGFRNYEMFSGGEAFRINLALRIALSKVLARRSGAPLPTLFIDEGFGTQDTTGREKILEVIRAIEPDFKKIIVITHLEEIREHFPVRIEVQKTEAGSTFRVT